MAATRSYQLPKIIKISTQSDKAELFTKQIAPNSIFNTQGSLYRVSITVFTRNYELEFPTDFINDVYRWSSMDIIFFLPDKLQISLFILRLNNFISTTSNFNLTYANDKTFILTFSLQLPLSKLESDSNHRTRCTHFLKDPGMREQFNASKIVLQKISKCLSHDP